MMLKILSDVIVPPDPVPPEPASHFWLIAAIAAGVVAVATVLTVVLIRYNKKKKN